MQPGYRNPDSEEADHSYTLKVLAYDTRDGKLLWERTAYEGVMWDNHPPEEHVCVEHGRH